MATTRAPDVPWTRSHLLSAMHLYTQLPFGKLHKTNPRIVELAKWQGRTNNSLAMKLTNLSSLDPVIKARGLKGLSGASAKDEAFWTEFHANWDAMSSLAEQEYRRFAEQNGVHVTDEVPEELVEIVEGKTRSATVQVRVNQWKFRKAILTNYNSQCCISGLANPQLLNASHILRWSDDHSNRMNPQNGLCLSAIHDRAYEVGLLTVMPDYRVCISETLLQDPASHFAKQAFVRFHNKKILMPSRWGPDPKFLEVHAKRFKFIAA
jgi:putative restriction endonuclease